MRRLREVGTESGQPQVRVDEIGKEGVLIVRVAFNPLHALRVLSHVLVARQADVLSHRRLVLCLMNQQNLFIVGIH